MAFGSDRPKGLEGTREFVRDGMPQFQGDDWADSVIVAEGDYVVQFGVRAGTWRGGPFLGFDVTPGPYPRYVAFCYRVRDLPCSASLARCPRDTDPVEQQSPLVSPSTRLPDLRRRQSR